MKFYKIYNKNKKLSFKKLISITLTIGLFLNNYVTSFASILSDDGRYETFSGNNITINDVLEEGNVDIEIEGNSLVNIAEPNQVIKLKSPEIGNYAQANAILKYPLKANTIYTISFNITQNPENHPPFASIVIGQGNSDSWSNRLYWDTNFKFNSNESYLGYHEVTFTTGSRIEETSFYWIKFIGEHWNNQFDTIIEDLIIVEGDVNNLSYFDGIKSVGELDNNTIEITSKNKNLFNDEVEIVDGNISSNEAHELGSEISHPIGYKRTSFIKIKPNTNYAVSIQHNNLFSIEKKVLYSKNKEYITYFSSNTNEFNSGDAEYLRIIFSVKSSDIGKYYQNEELISHNIMLNEITDKNDYVEPQLNVYNIDLNEPLRGLTNTVKDRIIKINNKWYIERNCGELIFDGSDDEKWWLSGDHSSFIEVLVENIDVSPLKSDLLPFNNDITLSSQNCNIGLRATDIGIRIRPLNKTDMTLSEGISWLSQNPITIVYKLAEPIYEPINTNLSVQLFEETTHLSNNSNIPANMVVTVNRTINRATEAIELAKTNPTIQNLSLARMWTNLLKETINKDKLQSQVNDITKVEDLQIEKKTATSNIDLYIKPLNSLSMSLSTNQIMFEDYSSVNDLDMDNALQISVSSSLPYQLNSYLETDIQNSNGSSKIDKDLLHIKEDTESEYKQFLGINQKLILKEDCIAGSNNIHNIDLRLKASAHDADVYRTTIKFEAEQK